MPQTKTLLISKFIEVAGQLTQLGNLSTTFAILAALETSAVKKEKAAWKKVSKSLLRQLHEV